MKDEGINLGNVIIDNMVDDYMGGYDVELAIFALKIKKMSYMY
jgi:hypothetical protein